MRLMMIIGPTLLLASIAAVKADPTDDRIALCDILSRVSSQIYSEKMSGMSFDDVLNGIPERTANLDQALSDQPDKLKMIHEIIHEIVERAYSAGWPDATAFAESQRATCLSGN